MIGALHYPEAILNGGNKRLALENYREMISRGKVLSWDRSERKVILTEGGLVVKVFKRKTFPSSDYLLPYAIRFERASLRLREMGIAAVEVLATYRIEDCGLRIAIYPYLEGESLRETFEKNGYPKELVGRFAGFLAGLHERGVYFRALHLGNVLLLPAGDFALLDISTVRFKKSALRLKFRLRNLRHLFGYEGDRERLLAYGTEWFFQAYNSQSSLRIEPDQRFSLTGRDSRSVRRQLFFPSDDNWSSPSHPMGVTERARRATGGATGMVDKLTGESPVTNLKGANI